MIIIYYNIFYFDIFYFYILMPHKSKDERPIDRKRDRQGKLNNIYSGKHVRQVLEHRRQQHTQDNIDKK